MRLRCRSNQGASLPSEYLDDHLGVSANTIFPLTIGNEYTVFGMTSFIGGIWYFIADDDFSFYPVWNPAGLFDIVDGNISPTWKVGHHWYGRRLAVVVAFEEWARDSSYYERLTAGDPAAVEIFRVYKAQLEAEHPPSPA